MMFYIKNIGEITFYHFKYNFTVTVYLYNVACCTYSPLL